MGADSDDAAVLDAVAVAAAVAEVVGARFPAPAPRGPTGPAARARRSGWRARSSARWAVAPPTRELTCVAPAGRGTVGCRRAVPHVGGSTGEAGEPDGRAPFAVSAPGGQLPGWNAEYDAEPVHFVDGEAALSAAAAAFGRAHGGGAGPPHQRAEVGLAPSLALAKDPDVRAHDRRLASRHLTVAPSPSRHHAAAFQVTL